ncbi:hypothetical protein [Micromonospora marina]|uniref:hypothetical protein n=1 Tax=Micromonospora marina TaxID=307120 RepID=UPI003456A980
MPEEKPKREPQPDPAPARPQREDPPARPIVPGPIGPLVPPLRGPGRVVRNAAPAARWLTR